MKTRNVLAAPCGLYCGVCGLYVAHKSNNVKLKEKLTSVYSVTVEQMECEGCLSDKPFIYCKACSIKDCTIKKGIEGCHECQDFPCKFITEDFPNPIGKKVILRSVPARRELGTEKWVAEEEKRYHCPHCGYKLFRGIKRCHNCEQPIDVD